MGLTARDQLRLIQQQRQDIRQYTRIVRDQVATAQRLLERQERAILSNVGIGSTAPRR